jgi:NTP pyrophosphohydrolases including oxidative damage repair enzymes
MNTKWKVLKTETLHNEAWLTVRKEHVQLPNGNEIPSYYVLDYPDWVNVIAITADGMFVMISQYRHGLGQANYELCAGVYEKDVDETLLVAAQRELLEETGYGNGNWQEYMTISANTSTHSNLTHCFLATGVEKLAEQALEASEDITVHLLTPAEVKQLLDANHIPQSLMAAPLWKYFAQHPL